MSINEVIEQLESNHQVCSIKDEIPNKWFWTSFYVNQSYFIFKGWANRRKYSPKQFLILKDRKLEAANKLLKFFPFMLDGEFTKSPFQPPIKKDLSLHVGYMQQAISMMFFEPLIVRHIFDVTKWVKLEDIILNDPFDYEISVEGAKKWFNRNYPRTFHERNVTNMPMPDGRDEWPMLRCSLFSFGAYDAVRTFNEIQYPT